MERNRKKAIILLIALVVLAVLGIFAASFLYHFFIAVGKAKISGNIQAFRLPEPLKVGLFSIFNADKTAHPQAFKGALMIAIGAFSMLFLGIVSKLNPKRSLYGDARFATNSEIKESGLLLNGKINPETLFAGDRIIVGKLGSQYIGLPEQRFAYLAAPTRSGKGTGVVNIVLLSYEHSIVVLDIKKELWHISAAKRQKNGHKVFLFDPYNADGRTARWNPLTYISRNNDLRIDDIQKIANTLIPEQGGDKIWTDAPRNLFTGLVLYLMDLERLDKTQVPTIRKVLDLAQQTGGQDIKTHFASLANQHGISQQAKDKINSAIVSADNTFSSILITLTTCLSPFSSELVANATSGDDFDLRNVRREKTTIYFGVEPADLDQSAKIINLFYTQLINENTRVLPQDDNSLKYQCLLLMDEGAAPGRIAILPKAVSYMAGYNLRMLLIVQSPSQLREKELYGQEGTQTILSNCALKILYTPNDYKDADEYSKLLGNTTLKDRTSKSFGKGGTSDTLTTNSRPLMYPQELLSMRKTKVIIKYDDLPYAIDATKNCHFKDKNFKDFAKYGRLKLKPIAQRIATVSGVAIVVKTIYDSIRRDYPDEFHGMYYRDPTRKIMIDEWQNTLNDLIEIVQ